jgi:hypothetical protein
MDLLGSSESFMLQTLLLLGVPEVFKLKALLLLSDLCCKVELGTGRRDFTWRRCLGPASQPAAEVWSWELLLSQIDPQIVFNGNTP